MSSTDSQWSIILPGLAPLIEAGVLQPILDLRPALQKLRGRKIANIARAWDGGAAGYDHSDSQLMSSVPDHKGHYTLHFETGEELMLRSAPFHFFGCANPDKATRQSFAGRIISVRDNPEYAAPEICAAVGSTVQDVEMLRFRPASPRDHHPVHGGYAGILFTLDNEYDLTICSLHLAVHGKHMYPSSMLAEAPRNFQRISVFAG